MIIAQQGVSVTDTPVKLYDASGTVVIRNASATVTVAIGGSDVTASTGFRLEPGATVTIGAPEDAPFATAGLNNVYAVRVGSTNGSVDTLEVG